MVDKPVFLRHSQKTKVPKNTPTPPSAELAKESASKTQSYMPAEIICINQVLTFYVHASSSWLSPETRGCVSSEMEDSDRGF